LAIFRRIFDASREGRYVSQHFFFSFFVQQKCTILRILTALSALMVVGLRHFLRSRMNLPASSNFNLADKILTFRVFQNAARALHT
jgi:hypothetical protein